nr:MAG TPA: hypothetical protein [Caudoviricetes sp.]
MGDVILRLRQLAVPVQPAGHFRPRIQGGAAAYPVHWRGEAAAALAGGVVGKGGAGQPGAGGHLGQGSHAGFLQHQIAESGGADVVQGAAHGGFGTLGLAVEFEIRGLVVEAQQRIVAARFIQAVFQIVQVGIADEDAEMVGIHGLLLFGQAFVYFADDLFGMVFRVARRAPHAHLVFGMPLQAAQAAKRMGGFACRNNRPAVLLGISQCGSDMFVGVLAHADCLID